MVGEKEERIQRNKSDMLVSKKVNSGYFNDVFFLTSSSLQVIEDGMSEEKEFYKICI